MHCYLPQAPLPNRNENHMIRRTTIATLILAAVIGSMAVAISPASAATTDEGDATAESRTANVPVLLSAALPLSDAITAGSATDMKIVGYRFENDGVAVGRDSPELRLELQGALLGYETPATPGALSHRTAGRPASEPTQTPMTSRIRAHDSPWQSG